MLMLWDGPILSLFHIPTEVKAFSYADKTVLNVSIQNPKGNPVKYEVIQISIFQLLLHKDSVAVVQIRPQTYMFIQIAIKFI
jgi:hypothetical protein